MIKWIFIALIVIVVLYFRKQYLETKRVGPAPDPVDEVKEILEQKVRFYQDLNSDDKATFLQRVRFFLSKIKITPVNHAEVTTTDRVYVAASAIIPLFYFKNWFYNNLDEVLIYPGLFTKDYDLQAEYRDVAGMVGDGALHRMMILSLPALRRGFERNTGSNTGIHEFVHLVDKSDGATDGVPETLFDKEESREWISLMHRTIQRMRAGRTDIDPYGATNEAEFFAVISEYFFQKPEQLKEDHPAIYEMLEAAFNHDEKKGH